MNAQATTTAPNAGPQTRVHDALLFALVFLRVLSFGLDSWSTAQGILNTATVLGCLLLLVRPARPDRALVWTADLLVAGILVAAGTWAAAYSGDQALGWGRWGTWAGNFLLLAYAWQVLPGRRAVLWAALLAAATVQCLLVMAQAWWVHPRLLQEIDFATLALGEDLHERLRHGGAYGTFDLANTLSNYLILLLAPILALLWRHRRQGRFCSTLGALVTALTMALWLSGSRAAVLSLLLAAIVVWALRGGRWRWSLLALLPALLALPPIWSRVQDNVAVRLDYWRGAVAMIGQRPLTGWGLDGFAIHGPRHLPLGSEPAQQVHNAILGAWVAGGLVLLVPLLLLGGLLLHRIRQAEHNEVLPPAPPERLPLWLAGLPLLLLPYLILLGELTSDNLAFWPGGTVLAFRLLSGLVLALPATAVAAVVLRLPPPPMAAIAIGLLAAMGQWLVDYSLINAAIVAGAGLVAGCLIPPEGWRQLAAGPGRRIGLISLPLLFAALAFFHLRADSLRRHAEDLALLEQWQQAPDTTTAARLTALVGLPPLPPDLLATRDLAGEAATVLYQRAGQWPASLADQRACLPWMPDEPAFRAIDALLARLPRHQGLHADHAALAAARGQPDLARSALRRAIELAPAVLVYRYRLWRLLPPGAERKAVATEALTLQERVHVRNRLDPAAYQRLRPDRR